MKLDTLILADAVTASAEEGKFYVHGGGMSRYEIAELPAVMPFGVLLRLKIEESDYGKGMVVRFTLIGPTGFPNVEPLEARIQKVEAASENRVEGEEEFIQMGLKIPAVAVREGLYHLELQINGKVARSVPLPVIVNPALKPAEREDDDPSARPPPAKKAKAKSSKSKSSKTGRARKSSAGKSRKRR
jgi:hypothetical protein